VLFVFRGLGLWRVYDPLTPLTMFRIVTARWAWHKFYSSSDWRERDGVAGLHTGVVVEKVSVGRPSLS
jgi:hypothetical protein